MAKTLSNSRIADYLFVKSIFYVNFLKITFHTIQLAEYCYKTYFIITKHNSASWIALIIYLPKIISI